MYVSCDSVYIGSCKCMLFGNTVSFVSNDVLSQPIKRDRDMFYSCSIRSVLGHGKAR